MRKKQIDKFFKELDEALSLRADVILVGASAGALMGHIRPSYDIDFEIRPQPGRRATGRKRGLDEIIRSVALKHGIAVNYSQDVDHWSMISYLDYRKTAVPYKKFGGLRVKLIAPAYWTIGKMTRFIRTDIEDMIKIIRKKNMSSARLVKVWADAANRSILSLELGQFRSNVIRFLEEYGKRAWGKGFESGPSAKRFLARVRPKL